NSLSLMAAMYERSQRQLFPPIVSPEGDPVIFHSSTYRVDDMSYVMKKLSQDSRFDYDPESGNAFIWKGPLDDGKTDPVKTDLGNRVFGTVLLMDNSITVECFTQNRWRLCVNLLKAILGDKMGPEIMKSETGIADAIKDRPHTSDKQEQKKSPEIMKIEQDLINAYYMKWMDEKIPALGGKTPREAARDPDLKQELISLLNDIERTPGPLAKVPRPPIDLMKKELGL
ncbi:MAG: hypothetical protein ACP5OC_08705, partial [Thermoplasmata archaeon]